MGTRRIPQDEVVLVVSNTYSKSVVVANRRVKPGQTVEIPARYVNGNIDRCQALNLLKTQGKIAVSVKFAAGGVDGLPVDSAYLLGLQAPISRVAGMDPPALATADLPASGTVPVGYEVFDITLGKPQYWDGAAWVDGVGL